MHNTRRVALVAGATRGAGRAIAVELARAGLHVYATGRSSRTAGRSEIGRPETIEDTGDRMAATGGRGTALVVDHEDPAAVAGLVARIESDHGRLDVLVNDIFGGDRYAQWHTPMWEHDLAGGLRMLRMGVDTHLITGHAALPLLLRSGHGLLVEMTDGTAVVNANYREGTGFFYDLVKANVSRIILALAHELRDRPVTALGVTPGWLRSEAMLEGFGVTEETWRDALAKLPGFAISESPTATASPTPTSGSAEQRAVVGRQELSFWSLACSARPVASLRRLVGRGWPAVTSLATSARRLVEDRAARRSRSKAAWASSSSRPMMTPLACSMSQRCSRAACSWSASRPLAWAVMAALSRLAISQA